MFENILIGIFLLGCLTAVILIGLVVWYLLHRLGDYITDQFFLVGDETVPRGRRK